MDKDFRTLLHEAATPRASETESTPRRTRTNANSSGNTAGSGTRYAESDAVSPTDTSHYPVDRLIEVWPTLAPSIRTAIMAIVETHHGDQP